jgi:hypothetical protein
VPCSNSSLVHYQVLLVDLHISSSHISHEHVELWTVNITALPGPHNTRLNFCENLGLELAPFLLVLARYNGSK